MEKLIKTSMSISLHLHPRVRTLTIANQRKEIKSANQSYRNSWQTGPQKTKISEVIKPHPPQNPKLVC